MTNVRDTHYLLGSALGPHPYPTIVREFQSVIGSEARQQILMEVGRLPDAVIACVGGGSNAIGIFSGFIADDQVELIGVEAGGSGIETGRHAARFGDPSKGRVGVIHGTRTYVLQDEDGQIAATHSVSAGLADAVPRERAPSPGRGGALVLGRPAGSTPGGALAPAWTGSTPTSRATSSATCRPTA